MTEAERDQWEHATRLHKTKTGRSIHRLNVEANDHLDPNLQFAECDTHILEPAQ